MPAGAFVPTTTPATRHISVFLGGKDVTPYVLQDSFVCEDAWGPGTQSRFSCTLNRKLSQLPELSPFDFVRVIDHDAGTDIFRGFVSTYRPTKHELSWDSVEIEAIDHGIILDNFWPGPYVRPAESVNARLGFFWGHMIPASLLNPHLTYVTATGTLAAVTYQGATQRRLLDEIAADISTTARWYLDQAGRLHMYTSETNNAPKDVTSDTPGGSEIAPEDLEISWDAGDYINAVYISGGNAAGSGWVYDNAAMAKAGVVIRSQLDVPTSMTAARRDAVGLRHLSWFTQGLMRVAFSTNSSKATGWLAGQVVNVRSAAMNINGTSRIVKVRTTLLSPTVRHYDIEVGATRRGFGAGRRVPPPGGTVARTGQWVVGDVGRVGYPIWSAT